MHRLTEQVGYLGETEVASPLPPGMSIAQRQDKLKVLSTRLKTYYIANKEAASADDKFFCEVTAEQLALHDLLAELNWLVDPAGSPDAHILSAEVKEYFLVAPWARADLPQATDFELPAPKAGANCFYHVFDVAHLADEFHPDALIHRVEKAQVPLSWRFDLSSRSGPMLNRLVQGMAHTADPLKHFGFLRLLQKSGWALLPLPAEEVRTAPAAASSPVTRRSGAAPSTPPDGSSSAPAPVATKVLYLYVPPFENNGITVIITAENYTEARFRENKHYFKSEASLLSHLMVSC